jgi:DUF177 domain-containing protein
MAARTDSFDLGNLGLASGEGRRMTLAVAPGAFDFGGTSYDVEPGQVDATLDISRMTHGGWALRLRFAAGLSGPCMRCLEPAQPSFEVDAREVSQPGGGEELSSPYLGEDEVLHLGEWARDALALELPGQLTCQEDCAGLCGQCGANLNEDPEHRHEAAPDPRWAKLGELKFD